MVSLQFIDIFYDGGVAPDLSVGKRFIQLDDEVILEVGGNASAVSGRITDDLVSPLDDFDVRSLVEGVDQQERFFIFGGKVNWKMAARSVGETSAVTS